MKQEKKASPKDGATRTKEWRARKKALQGQQPVQFFVTESEKAELIACLKRLRKSIQGVPSHNQKTSGENHE